MSEDLFELGDTIFYKVRLIDLPKDKNKVWKGKLTKIYKDGITQTIVALVVEVLDEGYSSLEEILFLDQIVRVEKQTANTSS